MAYSRIALILLLSMAPLAYGRSLDFGETVGATALGSAIGSAAGTIIGNVATSSSPRRRHIVYEEPVERVHIVSPRRNRRSRLEREASHLMNQIEDLTAKKYSFERRIAALEQELADTDTAIDIRKRSLRSIEQQQREISSSVCVTKGPEFAEIEVH